MNSNPNHSIIANRYLILDKLGEGGSAITYKAKDLQTSEQVAIKILSLRQVEDWKQIELFEREAKILQQLAHPRIPKYIDYFIYDSLNKNYHKLDNSDALSDLQAQGIYPDEFYLIQELVNGKPLSTLIEEGWQPDETEVKKIGIQVLTILIYLQQLIPPVTHRDIKPQNLIRSENGEVFLVDFGAVQDQVRQTTVGSSVVGTYGYMSPEQLKGGKTYPSTDLYGLGATLIYLLTQKHPSQFPQKRLKIDFRHHVKISSTFSNIIDKLIEPNFKNRLPSAQVALDILQGKINLKAQINFHPQKPSYSSIKLVRTPEKLTITIPSALNRKRWNYFLGFLGLGWYIIIFVILLIISVSSYSFFLKLLTLIYAAIIILQTLYLRINNKKYTILKFIVLTLIILSFLKSFNVSIWISVLILCSEFIWAELAHTIINELLLNTYWQIQSNSKSYIQQRLGNFIKQTYEFELIHLPPRQKDFWGKLLTPVEQQWLTQEIELFLKNHSISNQ